jgi:hypothetical protein
LLTLDADYIDKLNSQYEGGRFIKSVILIEDPTQNPQIIKYYADNPEAVTFNGNTYQPLSMSWSGIKTSEGMPTSGTTVTIANIGNQVNKYLRTLDITGNKCTLQILHMDLLNLVTGYWQRNYKILGVNANNILAVFTVGRNVGRNKLPREVMLKTEFPGLTSDR